MHPVSEKPPKLHRETILLGTSILLSKFGTTSSGFNGDKQDYGDYFRKQNLNYLKIIPRRHFVTDRQQKYSQRRDTGEPRRHFLPANTHGLQ